MSICLKIWYYWNLILKILTSDLKLEEWDKAIADCNSVLKKEEANVKGEIVFYGQCTRLWFYFLVPHCNCLNFPFPALLRRATAYKSQKKYTEALVDLKQVLNMESNNKTAKVNNSFVLQYTNSLAVILLTIKCSDIFILQYTNNLAVSY